MCTIVPLINIAIFTETVKLELRRRLNYRRDKPRASLTHMASGIHFRPMQATFNQWSYRIKSVQHYFTATNKYHGLRVNCTIIDSLFIVQRATCDKWKEFSLLASFGRYPRDSISDFRLVTQKNVFPECRKVFFFAFQRFAKQSSL